MSQPDSHGAGIEEIYPLILPPLVPKITSTNFQSNVVLLLAALLVLILYLRFQRRLVDQRGRKIPDGPQGLPVVGSFPFLTHYPERTLDLWAKEYGDLYSIWLGNQLFVIVSDPVIAKDLLVTNGAIFSGRKEMFIKSQTIFAGRGITATPYNEKWRKHRRLAVGWLSEKAVDSYTEVLNRESVVMINAMIEESCGGTVPINPQKHAGRCSLNNMTTITFGMRTDSIEHPLVGLALRLSREFMNCTGPMSNLVDFVPLLQWLPTPFLKRAKRLHQDLVNTYGGFINDIDQKLQAGIEIPDCLAKSMLKVKDEENLDDLDMAILASAFMIGGVETTASIMQWFAALIPAYPEIQRKAQIELDRVVGRDRLPTLEDEKNLPYVHAIIKEVERCRNPFWLGTPHMTTQDFLYKDQYFIPKDTVVVLNTYTIHHQKSRYPNPFQFNPDRYIDDHLLSSESTNLFDPNKRDHWMFGVGRRICPGMIVAEREIFLVISRMLWSFNLKEIHDHPIDLNEYDGLSGRSPKPFHLGISMRHENVLNVLENVDIDGLT